LVDYETRASVTRTAKGGLVSLGVFYTQRMNMQYPPIKITDFFGGIVPFLFLQNKNRNCRMQ
jgi:hypothetical protein